LPSYLIINYSSGKVEEKKEELVIPLKDSTPLWQRKLIAKRREKKNPTLQNGVKVERDALDVLAEEEIIRGINSY